MTFQTIVTNIIYVLDQLGGIEVLGAIFTVTIGLFVWNSFFNKHQPKSITSGDDNDDD